MAKSLLPKTIKALEEFKENLLNYKNYDEIADISFPTNLYLTIFDEIYQIVRLEYIKVREPYFAPEPDVNYDKSNVDYFYSHEDIKAFHHIRAEIVIISSMHTQIMLDILKADIKEAKKDSILFSDFLRNLSLKSYEPNNPKYLLLAFDFALRQGRAAAKWQNIQVQKDIYPFLKYTLSENCRLNHKEVGLDGIVRKIDDPFWDKFYPPNNLMCSCCVKQLTQMEAENKNFDIQIDENMFNISEDFQRNVGKDFTIFCDFIDELFP
ncbi:hypothetical protein JEZ13_11715 [bacterium]|nr:hypothetical protein [bacterium]